MEVTMLLCDAAQAAGGKLYILGGGWSIIYQPNVPTPAALAVKVAVPWDQANEPHTIRAVLITEDGEPVDLGAGEVQVEGQVEIGRPPGLKRGQPLDLVFVLNFGPLAYPAGGYVWELSINDEVQARTPFRVLPGQ
jgi:hypothetical protein